MEVYAKAQELASEELQRKEAIQRTQQLLQVKSLFETGVPPSEDEIRSALNVAQLQLDKLKAKTFDAEVRRLLTDVQDVIDAAKLLMSNKAGLLGKLSQLAKETAVAVQELRTLAEGAAEAAQGVKPNVESKAQQAMEQAKQLAQPTTDRARAIAERVLSLLKALSASAEARALLVQLAVLFRRLLEMAGGALEESTKNFALKPTEEQTAPKQPMAQVQPSLVDSKIQVPPQPKPTEGATNATDKPWLFQKDIEQRKREGETSKVQKKGGDDAAAQAKQVAETADTMAKLKIKDKETRESHGDPWLAHALGTSEISRPAAAQLPAAPPPKLAPASPSGGLMAHDKPAHDVHKQEAKKQGDKAQKEVEERLRVIKELGNRILDMAMHSPELRQSLREIFDLAEFYRHHLKELAEQSKQGASDIARQAKEAAQTHQLAKPEFPHARRAAELAKEILRELVPEELIDHVTERLHRLMNNDHFMAFFKLLSELIPKALDEADKSAAGQPVDRAKFENELNSLFDKAGDELSSASEEMRQMAREINDNVEQILNALKQNTALVTFRECLQRLADDLVAKNADGRLQLKSNALNQVRQLLVSELAEKLRVIALPPVEFENETYYLRLTDLVLWLHDIPAEKIESQLEFDWAFDLRDMKTHSRGGRLWFQVDRLAATAKNAAFEFRRMSFPRLRDVGHVDIDGKITLVLKFKQSEAPPYLSECKAAAVVDDLKISVQDDADHQVLLGWAVALNNREIERSIETGAADVLQKLGDTLVKAVNDFCLTVGLV